MAEIIAFDGHRKRVCSSRAIPHAAENRKPKLTQDVREALLERGIAA